MKKLTKIIMLSLLFVVVAIGSVSFAGCNSKKKKTKSIVLINDTKVDFSQGSTIDLDLFSNEKDTIVTVSSLKGEEIYVNGTLVRGKKIWANSRSTETQQLISNSKKSLVKF